MRQFAATGRLDPDEVLVGRLFGNYSGSDRRGGGKGGLVDCINSVAVSSIRVAVLPCGKEMTVVPGRMKIAAAISASLPS